MNIAHLRKIIVLLIFLAIHGFLPSQENLTLSIEQAREYALKNNKALRNSKNDILIAKKSIYEVISSYLPKVSYEYSFLDNLQLSTVLLPGIFFGKPNEYFPVRFGQEYQISWSIKTQQLILSVPLIIGIQLSSLSKQLAETGYLKTSAEIINSINILYSSIIVLDKIINTVDTNINNLIKLKNKSETLYNVGIIQATDVDQIKLNILNLQNIRNNLTRSKELSYNLLKLQLGVDTNATITLTTNLDQLINETEILNYLVEPLNLNSNYDFQLVKKQEEISKANLHKELSDALPTVVAFYNYSKTGHGNEIDQLRWFPAKVIGFSISFPIFTGLQNNIQISKAKVQYEKSKLNSQIAEDQLKLQEKQLKYNLSNAYDNYIAQKQSVELSQKIYKNIENKYLQGLSSSLDLTQAHTNYLNAQNNYYNAVLELLKSKYNLEKLYCKIN
ncbi:MAG: TolC family protein [Bacteroidales bacterium]|nr:TolC family protein [Bacteroidales bacterium]